MKKHSITILIITMAILLFALFPLRGMAQSWGIFQAPSGRAEIGYEEAISTLQVSGVPLYLPKVLVAPGVEGVYGATATWSSPEGYEVVVGNQYPCTGRACTEAVISSTRLVYGLPPIESTFAVPEALNTPYGVEYPLRSTEQAGWYQLSNGFPVYFQPWATYMGVGYSHLTWDAGSYRYDIALPVGSLMNLSQMAESIFQP